MIRQNSHYYYKYGMIIGENMNYQENFLDILEQSQSNSVQEPAEFTTDFCPECGDFIVRNGRCKTCYTCGWSSCDL